MELAQIRTLIKSHRSIRRFTNQEIPKEIIDDLIDCARWAPSSHNIQSYSIISIKNKSTKNILQNLCGEQEYISQCPVFFVFVADLYRHFLVSKKFNTLFNIEETENILIATVDTALCAQNFLIAARSYGLGGVMIGGIRNNAREVARVLNLPKWTLPIMGICIGYPNQNPIQKPRKPIKAIYHEEEYQMEDLNLLLDEFEMITEKYYKERTNGERNEGWGKQISHYLSERRRPNLTKFVKEQGFSLK